VVVRVRLGFTPGYSSGVSGAAGAWLRGQSPEKYAADASFGLRCEWAVYAAMSAMGRGLTEPRVDPSVMGHDRDMVTDGGAGVHVKGCRDIWGRGMRSWVFQRTALWDPRGRPVSAPRDIVCLVWSDRCDPDLMVWSSFVWWNDLYADGVLSEMAMERHRRGKVCIYQGAARLRAVPDMDIQWSYYG